MQVLQKHIASMLLFAVASALLFTTACKKDLLRFSKVQKLDTHTSEDRFDKILFLDKNTGFIVGGQRFMNATILTTHDGGYTWTKTDHPDAGKGLRDIVRAPSGALYACGFDGKLLRSYDTGKTWLFSQLEYFAYTGIAFPDAAHAIVVGGVSGNSGIRQYIDSSGVVLKRDSLPYQLGKIVMESNSIGYTCGYGFVQKTTDGGASWSFLDIVNDDFTAMDIHGTKIWVCGYSGSIFYSSNGGDHWSKMRNGNDITIPSYHLNGILFKDSQQGWAVGEEGKVIFTQDGGKHWSEYTHFTNSTLRTIALCPGGDLLIAGDNGSLFRVTP